VESPLRGDTHGGFGGRGREDPRSKDRRASRPRPNQHAAGSDAAQRIQQGSAATWRTKRGPTILGGLPCRGYLAPLASALAALVLA
jgi:hypothetical protein